MSYIFIKVVRKPPFSYFLKCLTEGKPKSTVSKGFSKDFPDFSRFPSKLGQKLSDSCQTLSKLSSMSSQTAYQQPINSLSTAYQQPINSSMSSQTAYQQPINSLSTAYQQLYEQSMSSR
jgi:hypothetical protein